MPGCVTPASRPNRAMRGPGAPGTGLPGAALAATALVAIALAVGCSAGRPVRSRATEATCYAFAVQALDQHVTVTSVPSACRGLNHEQINQAVVRAIRAVVGPHRKAIARRLAHEEAAYLAYLVTVVSPRGPAPPVAAPSASSGPSSGLPLRLGALAAWAVTAAAGAWLLAGWLAHGGLRRRYTRVAGVPRPVVIGHFSLALSGLGIWIGFVATGLPALAWVAVGVVLSVAGLGMATLAGGLPESRHEASNGPADGHQAGAGPSEGHQVGGGPPEGHQASGGPPEGHQASGRDAPVPAVGPARATAIQLPAWAGKPLAVIVLHGTLAATTILLVVLAAAAA